MKMMRTSGSVAIVLLLTMACATPNSNDQATQTSDPRYLVGSLAALEASQTLSLSAENPALIFAADETTSSGTRSLGGAASTVTVDDNGTPADKTDDILTITSTGAHWTGLDMTRVVVRNRKPVLTQLPVPGDSLAQTATETWYPSGDTSATPFATVTTNLTWENCAGAVVLKAFARSGERIGFRHAVPQILAMVSTYNLGEEVSKTVKHYRTSVDPANLLYTETFDRIPASGLTAASTKVSTFAPDGTLLQFRLVTRTGEVDAVQRFNAAGVLREALTRTQTSNGWTVERTKYKADGITVKKQYSETVVISSEGDTTHLVRTITIDDKIWQVTMDITVSGNTYLITKTDGSGAVRTWTAEKQDDGSWILTENGIATVITPDEVL